jgi:hypothetical protein
MLHTINILLDVVHNYVKFSIYCMIDAMTSGVIYTDCSMFQGQVEENSVRVKKDEVIKFCKTVKEWLSQEWCVV